jgi:hypothetical protein
MSAWVAFNYEFASCAIATRRRRRIAGWYRQVLFGIASGRAPRRERAMVRHGEVIHDLGDGWAIAWDATLTPKQLKWVRENAERSATELMEILGLPEGESE